MIIKAAPEAVWPVRSIDEVEVMRFSLLIIYNIQFLEKIPVSNIWN